MKNQTDPNPQSEEMPEIDDQRFRRRPGRGHRFALAYRRRHVLVAGGTRWDIHAVWQLRGKMPPAADIRIRFELELAVLDPNWQIAISRARELGTEQPTIDGIRARVTLQTVELHFSTYTDQVEPYGSASFTADLDAAIPFPRDLSDPAFVEAFANASTVSSGGPIQADEIETTERYWIFPVHNIGANGVIVDRQTGRAFEISGALDLESWIWGYEHGLLDDPPRDLVIEQVVDRDRAFAALRKFARVRREDLDNLPLVLEQCATWMAVRQLREADEALDWTTATRHIQPKLP